MTTKTNKYANPQRTERILSRMKITKAWCLSALVLLATAATGFSLQYGDFTYTKTVTDVTVTGYTGLGGDVTIPDTIDGLPVKVIGGSAFRYCTSLNSVTIPASVTSVSDFAFDHCSNLIAAYFLGSAPYLAPYVFFSTASDFKVYYFNSSTGFSSPTWAGYPSVKLTYAASSGNITILTCTGSGGSVIIPGTIGGLPVKAIGNNAFKSQINLTRVTVPGSVTAIGSSAFDGCPGLSSVYFMGSAPAPALGAGVFVSNSPDFKVYYLKTAPGFTGPSWTSYPTARLDYTTVGAETTIDKYTGPGGLVNLPCAINGLPVTKIKDSAFKSCASVTGVTIPDRVTEIGSYAFEGCSILTSVTLMGAAPTLGDGVFNSTASGFTVSYFNGASGFDTMGYPTISLGYAVAGAQVAISHTLGSGGSVNIPDTLKGLPVTGIGNLAFSGSTTLTSVKIPASVTSIGIQAFYHCTGLLGVTIPNSVTSMLDFAFESCTGLTSVVIPSSVTSIGAGVFRSCSNLTSVTIGANVTSIANDAFRNCTNLTTAAFMGNAPSMGLGVFDSAASGFTVNFFNSATGFDWPTWRGYPTVHFAYTTVNGQVTITASSGGALIIPRTIGGLPVTGIGNAAFKSKTSLTSVLIPNSVTSIGSEAFSGCTGLTGMTLPGSVTSIGAAAFSGCTGLTGVTIPANVTSIGNDAFRNCTNLASASFMGPAPSMGTGVFDSAASGFTIYYFNGATGFDEGPWTAYQTANLGYSINTDQVTITGYTGSGGALVIPSTIGGLPVTGIGNAAFQSNTSLTSVVIPSSVTSIGAAAFSGCTGLTGMTIPANVTSIADGAFSRCTGLTSMVIPNGVVSIGVAAFLGCTGLTRVTIPDSVTSIGDDAFDQCMNLAVATFMGDSPSMMGVGVFDSTASGFTVCYFKGAAGFTAPAWKGYAAASITRKLLPNGSFETGNFTSWTTTADFPAPPNSLLVSGNGFSVGMFAAVATDGTCSATYQFGDGTGPGTIRVAQDVLVDAARPYLVFDYRAGWSTSSDATLPPSFSVTVESQGGGAALATFPVITAEPGTTNPDTGSVTGVVDLSSFAGTTVRISFDAHVPEIFTGTRASFQLDNVGIAGGAPSLIQNGSFETGAFSGWTTWTSDAINGHWVVYSGTQTPGGMPVAAPTEGNFAAATEQQPISAQILYQDITVLEGTINSSLAFDVSYTNSHSAFITPESLIAGAGFDNQQFRVDIVDPAAPVVSATSLANVFTTKPGDQLMIGPTTITADLSRFAGSTIRLRFAAVTSRAPMTVGLDRVRLSYTSFTYIDTGTEIIITGSNTSPVGEISIPSSLNGKPVIRIENNAFKGCADLTGVTIPASVTSVGNAAFQNCTNLTSAAFMGDAPSMGTGVFDSAASGFTVYYFNTATNFSFPTWSGYPSVKFIYLTANGQIGITGYSGSGGALVIPSTIGGLPVTGIGYGAFRNRTSLTSVDIPTSVTSIADEAFFGSTGLASATIPNGVASIGARAFLNCTSLVTVTIPSSVTTLGSYAFRNCTNLTSASFMGNAPATMGTGVFDFTATGFTVFSFNGATGFDKFQWTTYQTANLNYTTNNDQITITGYSGSGGALVIPSSIGGLPVTGISYGAFRQQASLTSVTIPATVTSIDYAFSDCPGLSSINVDAANPNFSSENGVLFDKLQTTLIRYPAGLAGAYIIPASVTSIWLRAFSGCSGLTSVTIPSGVIDIHCLAFSLCTGLRSITIPNSVTYIGSEAFGSCSRLSSACFLGAPPQLGIWPAISPEVPEPFELTASDFKVYHLNGAPGCSAPPWDRYTVVNMGDSIEVATWLHSNGFGYAGDRVGTPNSDGVPLLMAYALNLDPTRNQSGNLPRPEVTGDQLRLPFYAGSEGVAYTVETSTDLNEWVTTGVAISEPDSNYIRTATIPLSGRQCFMRLRVDEISTPIPPNGGGGVPGTGGGAGPGGGGWPTPTPTPTPPPPPM